MSQETDGVRINKYLSEIGHCSRRAADKLIEERRIKVNGQSVVMGQKVTAQDRIEVDDILVEDLLERKIYIAFNRIFSLHGRWSKYVFIPIYQCSDFISSYYNWCTIIYTICNINKFFIFKREY